MKRIAFIIALLGVAITGCQSQYWTFLPDAENDTVAVVDQPEPEPEPPVIEPVEKPPEPAVTPKQVIFVLGIDGMD